MVLVVKQTKPFPWLHPATSWAVLGCEEYCEKTLEKCNQDFESESLHQSRQFVNYSKNNTQALSFDQIN